MKLKERFIAHVHAQFGRPNGFWGSIAGWIMAVRSSNRKRNVWAVSLLDVQHGDRILEIGFGPGLAIREISRIALDGVCMWSGSLGADAAPSDAAQCYGNPARPG
jgi:hypothetical protein